MYGGGGKHKAKINKPTRRVADPETTGLFRGFLKFVYPYIINLHPSSLGGTSPNDDRFTARAKSRHDRC